MKLNNVYCLNKEGGELLIYRGACVIGIVKEAEGVETPAITLINSYSILTFDDVEIVMDCWYAMKEQLTCERGERILGIFGESFKKS